MHRVDDRRVGSCRETHVVGMSNAQVKMASIKDKAKAKPDSLF